MLRRSAALALPVPTVQKHPGKILGKSWENCDNMSTESPETGKDWETRHDSVIHLGKLRLLQRFVNIVGPLQNWEITEKDGKGNERNRHSPIISTV